jgi:hypothetical protein
VILDVDEYGLEDSPVLVTSTGAETFPDEYRSIKRFSVDESIFLG